MSLAPQPVAGEFEALYTRLLVAERTCELLAAVDAHDLRERPARVLRTLIHLSYGAGQPSVHVASQRKLALLVGLAETHLRPALDFLVGANLLQIYPEQGLYEVLPDVALWKASPRCRRGLEAARRLTGEILQEDRRRRYEQVGFAEAEASFRPDPTLQQAIGENAREQAGLGSAQAPAPAAASLSSFLIPPAGEVPPRLLVNPPLHSPEPDASRECGSPSIYPRSGTTSGASHSPERNVRPGSLRATVRQSLGLAAPAVQVPAEGNSEPLPLPLSLPDSSSPELTEKGSSAAHASRLVPPKLTEKVSFAATTSAPQPPKLTEKVSSTPQSRPKLTEKVILAPATHPKLTEKVSFGSPQPRPAAPRACTRVTPTRGPSPISPSLPSSQLPSSSIFPSAEMGGRDAASLAGEDGQMAADVTSATAAEPGELPGQIRRLLGEERWRQWQRWLEGELAKPGGRLAAREALGELKLQLDLAAHGHRQEPIRTPGAWWLSKFRRLSGHQRRPPRTSPPFHPRSTRIHP